MKGGWLEHEIRSLPQVLACSITPDDVVVLVGPSADPATVEQRVSEVLRRTGIDRPVRVFGGDRPLFVEPVPVRNGRYAVVGSLGGAALLAAGVWLAGATAGLRGGNGKSPVITLAPPPPKKLVLIPMVGGEGPPRPLNPQEVTPARLLKPLKPLKPAAFVARAHRPRPANKPRPATPPPQPEQPPEKPPSEPEVRVLLRDVAAMVQRLGGGVRR